MDNYSSIPYNLIISGIIRSGITIESQPLDLDISKLKCKDLADLLSKWNNEYYNKIFSDISLEESTITGSNIYVHISFEDGGIYHLECSIEDRNDEKLVIASFLKNKDAYLDS